MIREFFARLSYRFLLPPLVWFLYRSLSLTWRISISETELMQTCQRQKTPMILAHFHGDELAFISLVRRYRIATIASTSLDGDLMSRVIHWLGGKTSRGSSTRGAVGALKGLLRLVKNENRNSSFAVDGPKGPIYKVKPGVFELSRLMQAPIFAGGLACDRSWNFPRSWNKTFLPKPFARIHFEWQDCFQALSKEEDPRDPALAAQLEAALHYSRGLADKKLL